MKNLKKDPLKEILDSQRNSIKTLKLAASANFAAKNDQEDKLTEQSSVRDQSVDGDKVNLFSVYTGQKKSNHNNLKRDERI